MVAALLGVLPACEGEVGEVAEPGSTVARGAPAGQQASNPGPIGDPGAALADPNAAGALGFRRLTHQEIFEHPERSFPGVAFQVPADTDADGDFGFAQAPLLSDDTTQRLLDTAEEIAGKAVQGLNQLLGCDVALNGEDACTNQFVETFGKRVYRRPLEGAEKDELVALAAQLKSTGYSLQD